MIKYITVTRLCVFGERKERGRKKEGGKREDGERMGGLSERV